MLEMTRERFEELVGEALDRIPPELTRLMDNVVILVEDESDPGVSGVSGVSDGGGGVGRAGELLGLYEGTPLTERGDWYSGVLPDRITVYRNPTLRICGTAEEVVRQVSVTVAHEIGHHFGISDARLHELGYG